MRPVTIAILGSKGGVGVSLVAANLAVYLATIGKRVLAVDADLNGSDLHPSLGVGPRVAPYVAPTPSFVEEYGSLFAGTELDPEMVNILPHRDPETGPIPGLSLLHGGIGEPLYGSGRRSSLRELEARLDNQDADYAVVNLGSNTSDAAVRFWCRAERRLVIAMPEPNAITGLYRLVRRAFAQAALDAAADPEDQRELHQLFANAGQSPAPADIASLVHRRSPGLGHHLRRWMEELEIPFIMNQARLRADIELGDQVTVAVRRRYGMALRYLGYIEYDDAVRTSARKRRPLLLESPGSRASRNIEKIARRLFAPADTRRGRAPWEDAPSNSHYDLLEVERGATDEEIRRAYKRMTAVFDPDNIVTFGLFDGPGLDAARARIDEAYDVLLDPARRRPYELSIFPDSPEVLDKPVAKKVPRGELPPPPPITPETEFSGAVLRAVRESQGTGLDQISETTKVGTNYLQYIEEDAFERLPAAVYVRGFVTEFAKYLKLDPQQVSQSYLRRFRAHFEVKA